jgi:threonine dehydrogenase-like Zn-dependent dehydrogenase
METTIDFGAGEKAFWGPLAALGDGIVPDHHYEKYTKNAYEEIGALAEGCSYEAASRGRFLAGKVAVIGAGGCGYVSKAGPAAKARYAQRAGATAIVIMDNREYYDP